MTAMQNPWNLTDKQAAVMDMIVSGGCNKTMARELGVGVKTVEHHSAKALRSIGVASRAHAAVLWDRWRRAPTAVIAQGLYAWTAGGMVPHANGAWTLAPAGGRRACPSCLTTEPAVPFDYEGLPMTRCSKCRIELNATAGVGASGEMRAELNAQPSTGALPTHGGQQ